MINSPRYKCNSFDKASFPGVFFTGLVVLTPTLCTLSACWSTNISDNLPNVVLSTGNGDYSDGDDDGGDDNRVSGDRI